MIEKVGEVVGKLLHQVGAFRLVGLTMAAAVVRQHRGRLAQRRRDGVPERAVHGERMDEHDPLPTLPRSRGRVGRGLHPATHVVSELRTVARLDF